MQAFQAIWLPETASVDGSKVCALRTERGPEKDRRATPFVRLFKVHSPSSSPYVCHLLFCCERAWKRITEFGAETAFKRNLKLPFVEPDALREAVPYLKRTLNLVDVEILSVEKAQAEVEADKAGYNRVIIESSEPGNPGFKFMRKR